MKFTVAVLASLVSVASARFTLTGAVNTLLNEEEQHGESYDVRIVVGGLVQDVSKGDLTLIGKSAVAAYNEIFDSVGFSIDGLKTHSTLALDSMTWHDSDELRQNTKCRFCKNDDFKPEAIVAQNTKCRFCKNDDFDTAAHSEVIFVGLDWYNQGGSSAAALQGMKLKGSGGNAKKYMAFEAAFCAKVRVSGSANLANAKDCTFSFLENPGSPAKKTTPVKSAYEAVSVKGAKSAEVQVTMMGLLHDFSESDLKTISQSILAAHEDAFSSTDYSLNSFNMVGDVDVSVDEELGQNTKCRFCKNDDFSSDEAVVTLITATALATDATGSGLRSGSVSAQNLAHMHAAFEKSFCNMLNQSSSANLANVRNCSFRFVDSPLEASSASAY